MRPEQRLLEAVTTAVAARGYRETSVADVLAAAGVSRSTFYTRFDSKAECFDAAHEDLVARICARVCDAAPQLGPPQERLRPPIAALFEAAAEHVDAARITLIDVHAAGGRVLERHREARARMAAVVGAALGRPHPAASAVVGGIENLLLVRVREGRAGELPGLVDPVVRWAARHADLCDVAVPDGVFAAPSAGEVGPSGRRGAPPRRPAPPPAAVPRGLPPGPKRAPRAVVASSVRERLLDAIGAIAAEEGYDALSALRVVERAATSKRSFYEHFDSIPEAFLAAIDRKAAATMAATLPAFATRREWQAVIVVSLQAWAEFLAQDPCAAALGFVESLRAGPEGIARRDAALGAFVALLEAAYRREVAVWDIDPGLAAELAGAALFSLAHDVTLARRWERLPELVPLMSVLTLTPALGAAQACRAVADVA